MTELEVTGLLLKLADLGVTGIKVEYEGSGDSGAIENIVYTTNKLDSDEETNLDNVHELDAWSEEYPNLNTLNADLESALQNFAYEKLMNDIDDWYNNEGGYGSIAILVPSGRYHIYNNIRYSNVETYQHDGSMIDKAVE